MIGIDITDEEAEARLQRRSESIQAKGAIGPRHLEQYLAYREELVLDCRRTQNLAKTKINKCLPDGRRVPEIVDAVLGTPAGKNEVRWTNLPGIKNRVNHLRAAITKLDNVIHACRRIVFDRYGFSQQAFDAAIQRGEIPVDPARYFETLMADVPVADPGAWTIIAAPEE